MGASPLPNKSESFPPLALLEMATGYWVSQAVYVAAKLSIADLLGKEPRSCQDLARETGAHPDALYRLMRALVSLGVFTAEEGDRFGLTPAGQCLQSHTLGSMRAMILTLGEEHYQAWGHLLHSVSTGKPAFDHVYQTSLFQYLAKNAAAGRTFDQAMANVTVPASFAIARAYPFSSFSTVVDVGGGQGALLRAILTANPELNGILFDVPPVIEEAKKLIKADGLAGRCATIAGDMFRWVPRGADIYILKNVLHDWDDDRSAKILGKCQRAMARNGKVLVVESVMVPHDGLSFEKLLDLNMLVISGGRERSEVEYRTLFNKASLRLTKILPTPFPLSVIEGVRKESR
jgi:O-methyltransferase/methyltransferase family protein